MDTYALCICHVSVSNMYPIQDTGYGTYLAYWVNIDKHDVVVGRDGGGRELNGGRMCMNKD